MRRLLLALLVSLPLAAQTVTPDESVVIQSSSKVIRAGLNLGDTAWYGNGNILKNIIGSNNPHMEPLEDQRIWALTSAGTASTFVSPIDFDNYPANYFAGAVFKIVYSQNGGAQQGCTGTIASNTGPNWPGGGSTSPSFTTSSPCAASFSVGDIVVVQLNTAGTTATTETAWESDFNGVHSTVSGGGKLLSETTSLCSLCGNQSLKMDATSGTSGFQMLWDSDNTNTWRRINGTYAISFDAKTVSGSPTLGVSANRSVAGGFSCSPASPTLTGSWAHYSLACSGSEPLGQTPGTAQVSFAVTGGIVDIDNVDFEKSAGTDPTNTTVFADETITNFRNANPGTLRYWITQQGGISADNWTRPDYARGMSNSQTQAYGQPALNGQLMPSIEAYLQACQLIGADPYIVMPTPWLPADAKNFLEFLAGDGTTTYGARRIALGQMAPWTSVFSKIHLEYGNENWNVSFSGEALFFRGSAPSGVNFNGLYYDYAHAMYGVFGAIRADSFYNSAKFDLVANAQTAQTFGWDFFLANAPVGSAPDSLEIQGYYGNTINQFDTDQHIWQSIFAIPWNRVTSPGDPANFFASMADYQSQHTCGAAGTSVCGVNLYEWGQGTINGSVTQNIQQQINVGSGTIIPTALIPLLNLQFYGAGPQNAFSYTEFNNGGSNANTAYLWGLFVDAGGATNNVRPGLQALQLINKSIMGTMYSCPLSGTFSANYAGNTNNGDTVPPGTPAITNLPYIYAFCFMSGSNRSMVLVNSDFSSHAVTLAGSQAPTGTVTTRQMAPSTPDLINEAVAGNPTNTATMKTSITTSTGAATSSVTLPPFSLTAIDFTSGSTPVVANPTFSPAAGTYTSAQSVTISTTTAGATICYTVDGTTPTATTPGTCSHGTTYSGPVSVSTSQTLNAIGTLSGDTNSSVATAAYVISIPAAFNLILGGNVTVSSITIN